MRTDPSAEPGTDPSVEPGTGGGEAVDPPADAAPDHLAPRGPRVARLLPWVLVGLAVLLAVVATWRWQELAAEERQREAVVAAAGDFTVALTNWDAADGMADTRDTLRASGTPTFAQDVDELFGGTEDLAQLTELGARSDGDVRDVFVQSIADGRARALAVVVQRLVTDAGQETNVRYARLDLERTDGRWLVDEVELLVDASQQATVGEVGGEVGG